VKATFRISFTDPDTGEDETVTKEFADTGLVTAREWAVDYAYRLLGGKPGRVSIEEVHGG
jgi:hypothetical protein